MAKQKKHIFGKILSIIVLSFIIAMFGAFGYFLIETRDVKLDMKAFSKSALSLEITDENGESVKDDEMFNISSHIKISDIPSHVKNAFISTEDRRFYKHRGIDVRRMGGAVLRNIKNRKFKEGASTITQQLIKNTHLSREKTIERKMKEIKLSLEVERKLSKNKILEEYLNTIYFGNGAYGIENASKIYFDKSAKNLTVGEGAMLAGVINAPRVYDPFLHPENAEGRKKLVLKLMRDQNKISEEEYQKNANSHENIVKNGSKTYTFAPKAIIREACDILKVTENQLKNMKIKIKCNLDINLQKELDSLIFSGAYTPLGVNGEKASIAAIIVDNKTKNVVAVSGKMASCLLGEKRQPGSLIKPIMVYAPALENSLISPETIIKDEPISINGYSPTNASKTYLGNVSARRALEKSLNVPAVKVLSNLGISRSKDFAKRLGIEFENADQNLALALGGMTKGTTLRQLADAYSAFASGGEFLTSSLISEITDERGKVLYSRESEAKQVMKDSTAYLITDMLRGVVKNGTAGRLKGFDFDLAAKTGTVGTQNSSNNQDAYTACYTSSHTIICYVGENAKSGELPSSVNGATYPASLAREILLRLYSDKKPESFSCPSSVVTAEMDSRAIANGKVLLANNLVEDKYKITGLFAKDNLPKVSTEADVHIPRLEVNMEEGEKPTLVFDTKKLYRYELYRNGMGKELKIYEKIGDGEKVQFKDISAKSGEIYEYYVVSYLELDDKCSGKSNTIKLMSY